MCVGCSHFKTKTKFFELYYISHRVQGTTLVFSLAPIQGFQWRNIFILHSQVFNGYFLGYSLLFSSCPYETSDTVHHFPLFLFHRLWDLLRPKNVQVLESQNGTFQWIKTFFYFFHIWQKMKCWRAQIKTGTSELLNFEFN